MSKKSLIILIAFALFGTFQFINPMEVKASTETLVEEAIDNVYYTRRGGGKPYMSAQYKTYTMNGKVVYCIEPGINITTHAYIGHSGLVASPYDSATNKKIELIGHYGYDYPGHQTLRYRMATQALIWEETGGQILEFWTQASGYGDYINLNKERNEIMKLVNAHYNKPSFNGNSIEAVVGQEFKITDTNGLLSEYEIYNSDNFKIRIDGNDIYATPLAVGDLTLSVVRKHYDNNTTIVFHGTDGESQKMGYFRFSDPVVASVKVKSIGGDIAIYKLDNDTQSSTPQGSDSTLKGAVYGIYNYSDTLITTITTDENGYAKSDILPDIGDYYLQEITPSTGYELDTNKYYFSITTDSLHPEIKVYEDIIDRDLELYKFFANADTGILTPESSIKFGIYDSKGNHIRTIETDNQGYAKTNLVYGTYTFKQLNTTQGHEKVKDFQVVVNSDSPEVIKYSLSNAPITAKLKVVKIDEETGLTIPLKGITFKIKNTSTNEYVCQQITYPSVENVCEFKTDTKGILYTPFELKTGTYTLEEIDQIINGYLWNNQSIEFTIDDNSTFIDDKELGTILEIKFANKQVKGKITINKQGEELVIDDNTYSYKNINLEGATFEVRANEDVIINDYKYYNNGDVVGTLTTNENGYAYIDNLPLGKYTIQEISSNNGNMIDNKVYEIELTYKDQYTEVIISNSKLQNYLPKATLEFTKTDLTTGIGIKDTKIEIYTEDDKLIYSGITDSDGKITIDDLFTGKFYIIETEASTGYKLSNEKVYFEILENGEVVKANMTNEKIKGTLEFTKVDVSNDSPLPNTTIEIYDEKDNLIYTGITDENGNIIIENLEYGKYYILEKNAPDGYLINAEKMCFEILEDGEIVKAVMKDESVKVPNTGLSNINLEQVIYISLIITGLGFISYGIIKKKK